VKKVDIMIRNGLILDFKNQPFIGSLAIDKGVILEIAADEVLSTKYIADDILVAENKIVLPGFINTHTHLAMSYFKGLADDLPLMDWLMKFMWPAEKKFLTPDFVADAALHGCAEMIKNGITCFNDMYVFCHKSAEASRKAGIRAVLGEGLLDYPMGGFSSPAAVLDYTSELKKEFDNDDMIDIAIAPHSIYTCNRETLMMAKAEAEKSGMMLHIHLSETEQEVEDSLRNFGKRPAEYLDELGIFDLPVIAAHCIWLNESEQNILAEKNVSISINTSSNLKLASGFDAFNQYLRKGINLSLATDSVASNNNLSMLQEISLTAKLQKTICQDPTILPAQKMLEIATLGGAKALGKDDKLGKIAAGTRADVILIDVNCIQAQPIYDPYAQIVYSLFSENISDVVINGKIVMKNRSLILIDEEELIDKAKFYRNKIAAFLGREIVY
jgi:Cytosine deaminase and related metal-dependent hydrolases